MATEHFSLTNWLFPLRMRCPTCARKNAEYERHCRGCGHVFTVADKQAGFAEARRRRFYNALLLVLFVVLVYALR